MVKVSGLWSLYIYILVCRPKLKEKSKPQTKEFNLLTSFFFYRFI